MLKRKEMEHCDKIGFPPLHQPFILQLVFSSTQKVIFRGKCRRRCSCRCADSGWNVLVGLHVKPNSIHSEFHILQLIRFLCFYEIWRSLFRLAGTLARIVIRRSVSFSCCESDGKKLSTCRVRKKFAVTANSFGVTTLFSNSIEWTIATSIKKRRDSKCDLLRQLTN